MGNSDTSISVLMSQTRHENNWADDSREAGVSSSSLFKCHILGFRKEIPHRVVSNTFVNKCGMRKAMGVFLSHLDKRSRTTSNPVQSAPPKPLTRLLPQLLQLSLAFFISL